METLHWDQARRVVEPIDPPLALAFDNIYQTADCARRAQLTVVRASYAYGADVVLRGIPKDDIDEPMPEAFVLPTRLPFGLITRNKVEVLESVITLGPGEKRTLSTRLVPQALLGVRQLVGAFELLDWKTSGAASKQADWNITAGSRTTFATERHNNNRVARMVLRRFGIDPPNRHTLFEWLSEIPTFVDEIKPAWRTDILYFARSWFDDDVRLGSTDTSHQPSPAREMYHLLLERAWSNLSSLRPNSRVLYDVLREADDRGNPKVIEAAFQLLYHWSAICEGTRPCFSPTFVDDGLGPFGMIVDSFLRPLLDCRSVLRPTYLSGDQTVGYIKLDHIAPVLFAGQIEKNLLATMRLIIDAAKKAIEARNHAAERVLGWPHMFNNVIFRFPPGEPADRDTKGKDTQDKSLRTVRFVADKQAVKNQNPKYKVAEVSEADFFSCYREQPLPRQRCEFFNGSLRVASVDE